MYVIGITICLVSIVFFLIILFSYFSKKRVETQETKLYTALVVVTFFIALLEIGSFLIVPTYKVSALPSLLINKTYISLIYIYITFLSKYMYNISFKNTGSEFNNKLKITIIILQCTFGLAMILAPLNFYSEQTIVYSYGMSVDLLNLYNGINIFFWFVCIVTRGKKIDFQKYYPVMAFSIMGSIILFLKIYQPGLNIVASIIIYATIIMYHTIENPDIKIIERENLLKRQAQASDIAKNRILKQMSHEIRTPLNHAMAFNDCNLTESNLDEVKSNSEIVADALKKVNNIQDNCIKYSDVVNGKLEMKIASYKTNALFEDIIEKVNLDLWTDKTNIQFSANIEKDIPKVLDGDQSQVFWIITELLTNAFKFTKTGSISLEIKWKLQNNKCRLIISISDTGVGMKNEDIKDLFKAFERIDFDDNQFARGGGLGLSIAKKLATAMNGDIIAKSKYGNGTTFILELDQGTARKEGDNNE